MRTSLCFLIAGFAAMIPATATSAEPDDFLACREVASDEARLQCYDAIADRAAPETAEQEAAPVSETVAPEAVAATPPVSETVAPEAAAATLPATSTDLFGRTGEELTEIIADAMGFEMVDEINARVAEARLDQYKRFVIVLDNQQRWPPDGRQPL